MYISKLFYSSFHFKNIRYGRLKTLRRESTSVEKVSVLVIFTLVTRCVEDLEYALTLVSLLGLYTAESQQLGKANAVLASIHLCCVIYDSLVPIALPKGGKKYFLVGVCLNG